MNKEEIKELINSIEERLIISQEINEPINPDLDKAIRLSVAYEELQQENKQLKELYKKTCKHLFDIGNDELARYFEAQIDENNTFMVGDM